MDVLAAVALRIALVMYCVAVPGWAFLSHVGFSSRSWIDYLIAGAAAGSAITSLTVTLLLLAGVYTRPVAVVLLLAAAVWLRRPSRPSPQPSVSERLRPAPSVSPVDRAVLSAVAVFLVVYLA